MRKFIEQREEQCDSLLYRAGNWLRKNHSLGLMRRAVQRYSAWRSRHNPDWVPSWIQNRLYLFLGGQYQTCNVCKRRDKLEYHAKNETWEEVVPFRYRDKVVCLPCFDDFARNRNVEYDMDDFELFMFVGDKAHLSFNIESSRTFTKR